MPLLAVIITGSIQSSQIMSLRATPNTRGHNLDNLKSSKSEPPIVKDYVEMFVNIFRRQMRKRFMLNRRTNL